MALLFKPPPEGARAEPDPLQEIRLHLQSFESSSSDQSFSLTSQMELKVSSADSAELI